MSEARVDLLARGDLVDHGDELLLQALEDRRDLLALRALLVVVEQDVVRRLAGVRVALDVLELQLDVAAQERQERVVVRVLARLGPRRDREHLRLRDLGAQLGRDLPVLLPVLARDADQLGVDRVRVELLLVRAEPVEELADLVGDEELVREPVERGELVAAGTACRRAASSCAGPSRGASTARLRSWIVASRSRSSVSRCSFVMVSSALQSCRRRTGSRGGSRPLSICVPPESAPARGRASSCP